jgi:hypothetical protein
LGPVILPGAGICWSCWSKREKQHHPWPERREALLQYYDDHPQRGPLGFLGPFAMLSASRLSAVIDEVDSGTIAGGYVWQIDMINRKVSTAVAVGIHDCPRCGLHRSPTTRSYSDMREKLKYLWAEE